VRLVAAAIGAVLIVLGVLLWQVTSDDTPVTAAQGDSAPAVAEVPSAPGAPGGVTAPRAAPAIADARPMEVEIPEDPEPFTGVLRPKTAEFWDHVDGFPHRLLGFVSDCYKGGEDSKAKLKLSYRLSVVNRVVQIRDVKVVESTLKDATLEDCFVRSIQDARFDDDQMPDFESPEQDPEDLLIRIETLRPYGKKKQPR
jgi:hypothetical protein